MSNINKNNLDHLGSLFEQYEAPFSADEVKADWQQVADKIGASGATQGSPSDGGTSSGLLGSVGAKLILGVISLAAIIGAYTLFNKPTGQDAQITTVNEVVKADKKAEANMAAPLNTDSEAQKDEIIKQPAKPTTINNKPNKLNDANNSNLVEPDKVTTIAGTDNNDKPNHTPAQPDPRVVVSGNSVCQNAGLVINVKHAKQGNLYWFNMKCETNGVVETGAFESKKVIVPKQSGTYELVVFLMSGNEQIEVFKTDIDVIEKPKAEFDYTQSKCEALTLTYTGKNKSECFWTIDNKSYSGEIIDVNFKTAGSKKVVLIAKNNGCADTLTKDVSASPTTVDLNNLAIPNIFTPNGDGKNDAWDIVAKNPQLEGLTGSIEIREYQTGRVVYKTENDLAGKWNGKFMNVGRDCQPGYYSYVIKVNNPCGNKPYEVRTGLTTIKRN